MTAMGREPTWRDVVGAMVNAGIAGGDDSPAFEDGGALREWARKSLADQLRADGFPEAADNIIGGAK